MKEVCKPTTQVLKLRFAPGATSKPTAQVLKLRITYREGSGNTLHDLRK